MKKEHYMKMKRYNINAVLILVVINIIMFILQGIFPEITDMLGLMQGDAIMRPWTLLTSMFLHGSVTHIFFNMYVLLMFGQLVEQRIGSKRFLGIYLISGLVASFISSFFYSFALGASGAIMGIIGVVIMLMPNLQVLFFFVIPMPLWFAGIVIVLLEIFLGAFVPSNIGHIAHLSGIGCGLLYGRMLKKKKRKFDRKMGSKTHLDESDIDEYLKSGRI